MQLHLVLRLLTSAALLAACAEPTMPTPPTDPAAILDPVTLDQWKALSGRRIFFGHMSVGGNMADGIAALLREHPDLPLRLIRTSTPDTVPGGALFHNFVGENGDPSSKTAAFARIVTTGMGRPVDVGMQKFCYADFSRATAPESVFAAYEQGVEALRRARPDLQIVHFTVPVTEGGFSLKEVARMLLGRQTEREQLAKVRRYNELLRARYSSVDPIFDLAAVETGSPDTPAAAQALHPAYATPDGGHLNETGQRVVAAQFLVFLATLPAISTAS